MNPTGKWLEGFGPESAVHDVARAALEARLAAVSYWLPAAAYCADHDVEHVHRLRVSTRRAMAALKLFRDWLPKKQLRRVKKQLKKIRQAAGSARDLDVFHDRLQENESDGAEFVRADIAERRAAVQPEIERVADRLRRKGRFVRKVRDLLAGVKPRGRADDDQPEPFRHWAKRRLAELAHEFFDAEPDDVRDTAALHQFRISGKRLRYAMELLAPGLDPDVRNTHYPVVEELQERLGKSNDHAWAAAQLREWMSDMVDPQRTQLLQAMAQHETQQLDELLRDFQEWWTPERSEALRSGFMNDTTTEKVSSPTMLVS